MDFPLFQVPYLGNGMTIALDAVTHVYLSHGVAIGVVLVIALSEYRAARSGSAEWERFAKDLLEPTVIVVTGIGAVTGVGIWFTISSLAPAGTGSMMRLFFWPWFIEWGVFTVEAILLLVYYYTWPFPGGERDPRARVRHSYLGFAYVLFAIVSAFIITAILGFMLTSDDWPWSRTFASAFLNPSFPPQILFRLGISFGLGVILATGFLVLTRRDPGFRKQALGTFGAFALASVIAMAAALPWYYAVVPATFRAHAIFAVLTSHFSQSPWVFWAFNAVAFAVLLGFAAAALARRVRVTQVLFAPALVFMLAGIAEFERVREFVRGPYLMPGYMYANQVLVKERAYFDERGMLANSYWFNAAAEPGADDRGAYLFGQNCSVCHTIGGLNDIRARFRGRSRASYDVILDNTHRMVPFMAPFAGTAAERRVLADFLYRVTQEELSLGAPSRFLRVAPGKGGGQ